MVTVPCNFIGVTAKNAGSLSVFLEQFFENVTIADTGDFITRAFTFCFVTAIRTAIRSVEWTYCNSERIDDFAGAWAGDVGGDYKVTLSGNLLQAGKRVNILFTNIRISDVIRF